MIGAGLAWFNRLTDIDPMWKLLITTGFLRRVDHLLHLLGGSGLSPAAGAGELGTPQRDGEFAGFVCHDGRRLLAFLAGRQPLTI